MYLSMANVNCSVFMPEDAIKTSEATISSYGQQVFRVMGDYAKAKEIAAGYAAMHNIPLSTGNIDPCTKLLPLPSYSDNLHQNKW